MMSEGALATWHIEGSKLSANTLFAAREGK